MTFPQIILEVGFGQPTGGPFMTFDNATTGKFDTGQFADTSFGWVDLSDRGRAFSTQRGRARVFDSYQAGKATLVLSNADDALDPSNVSSPYHAQLFPMVPVRIRVVDPTSGTIYPVWRGFVDSFANTYPGFGKDSIATIAATDGFKVIAAYEASGPNTLTGTGEDAGARITRIANNISWSLSDRDINTGYTLLQGTPLGDQALTEMQGVEQSELGYLYIGKDGRLTFRQRHSRITDTRSSVVQAAFGGSGFDYADITFAYDDLLIRNSISGQVLGGIAQTIQNSVSVAKYLAHSYNATGLWLQDDPSAAEWAAWVAQQFLNPELRVESITVLPQKDDTYWPVVLGLEIGDLVTVTMLTPAGATVTKSLFVEGIDHTVTANPLSWTTKFTFSDASVLQNGLWFIFDNATMGKFDTNEFAA